MKSSWNTRILSSLRDAKGRRAEARAEGEKGFTLIELMVVLLIMAILLAIAIPTFLGVKNGAQDRSVQSDLTNATISAKALYTNAQSFPANTAIVASLSSIEPEMTFLQTSVVATLHNISVSAAANGTSYNNVLMLAGESADGRCWYATDNESGSSYTTGTIAWGQGVQYSGTPAGTTQASCTAGTYPSGTVTPSSSYPA